MDSCARLHSSVATTQSLIGWWFGKCTGLQLQGVLAKSEEYLFFLGSLFNKMTMSGHNAWVKTGGYMGIMLDLLKLHA